MKGNTMIRALAAAAFITATLIAAPAAQAAPKHCAKHDAGHTYIHACAKGASDGMGDPYRHRNLIARWNATPGHPNHNKYSLPELKDAPEQKKGPTARFRARYNEQP